MSRESFIVPNPGIHGRKPLDRYRIAVSPPGYDDMLPVLIAMNLNAVEISNSLFGPNASLASYDMFFANCGSRCLLDDDPGIGQCFVGDGGVVYASDWKDKLIIECFPGVIETDIYGPSGIFTAEVVDPDLKAIIGNSIDLNFDECGWHYPSWLSDCPVVIDGATASPVKVHLIWDSKPLIVSFSYGRGHVIYTSFHNHAQASGKEQALIRFLALKPLSMASGIAVPILFNKFGKKG